MINNPNNMEIEFAASGSADELPEHPDEGRVAEAFRSSEDSGSSPVLSKSIFDEWEEERAFGDEPRHPVKLKPSTVLLLMAVMALEFVWGVMPYVTSGMIESSPFMSRREIGAETILKQIDLSEGCSFGDSVNREAVAVDHGAASADANGLHPVDGFRLTSLDDEVTDIPGEVSGEIGSDAVDEEEDEDDGESLSFNTGISVPSPDVTIIGGGSLSGVVEGTVTPPGEQDTGDYSDELLAPPSSSLVATYPPSVDFVIITDVKVENVEVTVSGQSSDTALTGLYSNPLSGLGDAATVRLICLVKLITGLKLKENEGAAADENDEECVT